MDAHNNAKKASKHVIWKRVYWLQNNAHAKFRKKSLSVFPSDIFVKPHTQNMRDNTPWKNCMSKEILEHRRTKVQCNVSQRLRSLRSLSEWWKTTKHRPGFCTMSPNWHQHAVYRGTNEFWNSSSTVVQSTRYEVVFHVICIFDEDKFCGKQTK